MNQRFLLATTLLSGTIVGAGMFALPYLASRVGLLTGFFYLFFFAGVYMIVHLMYGQVVAKEAGEHRFLYFARLHFPKLLADFAGAVILAELVFILAVYLILAPTFIGLLWSGGGLASLLIFWLVGSAFVFVGLGSLGLAEFLGVSGILTTALLVFFASFGRPLTTPLIEPLNLPLLFLPFGPMLFSFAGRPAVSKVVEESRRAAAAGQPFSLKKAVFLGTFLPVLVYGFFIFGVLKINPLVSPQAINSLGSLNPAPLVAIALAGLLALWTSYFIVVVNVKEILVFDLKVNKFLSASLAIVSPLLLFFLGLKNFLPALSFTGGVFLSLEAVFIIGMWRRAFPQNRFSRLSWFLVTIFVLAIVYEFANLNL